MDLYYNKAFSLNAISNRILKKYNYFISEASILRRIYKISRLGFREVMNYHPTVGQTWLVNETRIRVLGKNYCLVDIMDTETKFLLASRLLTMLTENNIKSAVRLSINKAGKIASNLIFINKYDSIKEIKFFQDRFFSDTHITILDKEKSPEADDKYFHSFIKRNKLISNLKKRENINIVINGWIFHYNFRRVHDELFGKTPAEKASLSGI